MLRIITFFLLFACISAYAAADITASVLPYSTANRAYFTDQTAGPGFLAIQIRNNNPHTSVNIDHIYLDGNTPNGKLYFKIMEPKSSSPDPVYGNYHACETGNLLEPHKSCLIVLQGFVFDASLPPLTATLSVIVSSSDPSSVPNKLEFQLSNQTMLYAAGAFTQFGNVSLPNKHYLIAQCAYDTKTASVNCQNAIQDAQNYADAPINRVATPGFGNSNLYIAGKFNQVGAAKVPAGKYLVAKCSLGNCVNGIDDAIPYADKTIRSLTVGNNFDMLIVGDFNQFGSASVPVGKYLVARCPLHSNCQNYFSSSEPYADNKIFEVRTDNALGLAYFAGSFHKINGFDAHLLGSQSFLARCNKIADSIYCDNALPSAPNNFANNTIRFADMEDLGRPNFTVYLAGSFSEVAGVSVEPGEDLLAKFTHSLWLNYLNKDYSEAPFADREIDDMGIDCNHHLFIAGKFNQLATIPSVGDGHYLLARCQLNGSNCVNYLAGLSMPYANGAINSIALGAVLTATQIH